MRSCSSTEALTSNPLITRKTDLGRQMRPRIVRAASGEVQPPHRASGGASGQAAIQFGVLQENAFSGLAKGIIPLGEQVGDGGSGELGRRNPELLGSLSELSACASGSSKATFMHPMYSSARGLTSRSRDRS
jgi:hypothetical protein